MDIDELVNRPSRYLAEDGVGELMLGLMLVVTSSASLEAEHLPADAPGVVLFGALLGMAWGARTLKQRVTSPRGGYVALDDHVATPVGRVPAMAWSVATMLVLGAGLVVFSLGPVAVRAGFVGALAFPGIKYRVPHMLWLAAFCAAVSVWTYERKDGLFVLLLWMGAALTLVGGVRLWQFVQSHPMPTETTA